MKISKCPKCSREMAYNYHYHCYNCASCDKVYNGALQELRPISEWRDEYNEDDY